MRRKFSRIAATVMAAAMLFQQCEAVGVAEESEVQETQELAVEAEAPATEATAPAAEAPATEAPAPATEAPATEAPAPATEAPATEAPATEAPAPVTEAPATEAPATEAPAPVTEAPETEGPAPTTEEEQTEKTKKKKKKKETENESESETETERSERVNDGKKIEGSMLTGSLASALPYLFAAGTVELPETTAKLLEEMTDEPESLVADGAAGSTIVNGLENFSKELADGQSTAGVQVINLYADANGKLDCRQLTDLYKDQVLDVTDKCVVVNVIAAEKDQALSFSDYALKDSGQTVAYHMPWESGDILYNFAYLSGEDFEVYEGTLTLASADGLQGTFLAPGAKVTVQSGMAGAIYADKITVASGVKDLMRVVLMKGAPELQTEAATQTPETETPEEVPVTEAMTQTPETEAPTEAATQTPETEAPTEAATQTPETETPTEAASEVPETDMELEISLTEAQSEDIAAEEESESETASKEETQTEDESGPEEMTEEVVDLDTAELHKMLWYSEEGVQLQVALSDADDTAAAPLAGGKGVICAAETIYGENETIAFEKDAEAAVIAWEDAATAVASLNYGGSYYLQLTELPAAEVSYLMPSRIYLNVSEEGTLTVGGDNLCRWDGTILNIPLQKQAQVVFSLIDEEDASTRLSGAAFIVKHADGTMLSGMDGKPGYYLEYQGADISLYGLPAGDYLLSEIKAPDGYLIAEDTAFTVSENAEPIELKVTNKKAQTDGPALVVTANAKFNKVQLTAQKEQRAYVALYDRSEPAKRVSEVKELIWAPGSAVSGEIVFTGLADNTVYDLVATDEFGNVLAENTGRTYKLQLSGKADASVSVTDQTAVLEYQYTTYPDKAFGYEAKIPVTVETRGTDGKAKKTDETFYVMLYEDKAFQTPVLEAPLKFEMNNKASRSVTAGIMLTKATEDLYVAQVDAKGTVIHSDQEGFAYSITYQISPESKDQKVTVVCGSKSSVTVIDQLNGSVVKIRVEDGSGNLLQGARLVLKNKETGKIVNLGLAEDGGAIFQSGSKEIVLTNKIPAGTYLLTELTAPSGYQNTADAEIVVTEGTTAEAVLKNEALPANGYTVQAVMQVYSGDKPVYARDLADGTYAAEGRYTFYAALFADADRSRKISDVQAITVDALSGVTNFEKLPAGTYYLTETDEYGNLLTSKDNQGTACRIEYTNAGKIVVATAGRQAVIRNTYEALPRGYRYTAVLTLAVKLQNTAGEAESAAKTFYAGIYRNADYSDTPTIVALPLENTSEASARRRILLSGEEAMTYYIAEVDENGRRITENSGFGYNVSIDQPQVTLAGGDEKTVTITNRAKVSKVTLYLTKKVYQGTEQKAVNATFYAGLFKDPEFTQLYTDPIPLTLNGKSSVTLKLTLNLGSASETTIYVAEVDKEGRLVKEGAEFGYEIRVVNATAAFTQERTEIQSILLNSVYTANSGGTDWGSIISGDGNNIGGGGYYPNGTSGPAGDVQTGDETPILPYVIVLVLSAIVIVAVVVTRKRKK